MNKFNTTFLHLPQLCMFLYINVNESIRYLIPLPEEAAIGAPWNIFSSDETIGVMLTRRVRQPAQILQKPFEEQTPVPPLVH